MAADAAVRPGAAVLVGDGVIEAIVARRANSRPRTRMVVELGGRTLMPGLIDAHAHVRAELPRCPTPAPSRCWPTPARTSWRPTCVRRCAAVITTVRDVGSYDDIVFEARQAMRYGAFRGPRLLTCGAIVSATAPGGRWFPGMYREADGPDDVRRAVREQLRRGADFIKAMTTGARSVELEDPDPAQMTRRRSRRSSRRRIARATGPPRTRRGWPAPSSRSSRESTRSSTASISTSGLTCWSRWPPRVRCWCRRSRASTASPAWTTRSARRGRDRRAQRP